jgi:hypothetical protein
MVLSRTTAADHVFIPQTLTSKWLDLLRRNEIVDAVGMTYENKGSDRFRGEKS